MTKTIYTIPIIDRRAYPGLALQILKDLGFEMKRYGDGDRKLYCRRELNPKQLQIINNLFHPYILQRNLSLSRIIPKIRDWKISSKDLKSIFDGYAESSTLYNGHFLRRLCEDLKIYSLQAEWGPEFLEALEILDLEENDQFSETGYYMFCAEPFTPLEANLAMIKSVFGPSYKQNIG